MIRGRILNVQWGTSEFEPPSAIATLSIDPDAAASHAPLVLIPDPIVGRDDWQTDVLDRVNGGRFCGGSVTVTYDEENPQINRAACSVHGTIDTLDLGPPTSCDRSDEIRAFLATRAARHQQDAAADLIRFLVAERDRPVSWWRRWRAGVR